ncbi:MAG: tRNA lysidine(34) synthetase TilS [Chthoniobacterales bacterium]|nr:tRNA lysidine(34) synthetase TilS [Chthoniobacterales bacterium]
MKNHPLRRPFLVGVSGGRDSMVLLHVLKRLGFSRLIVCHLDHGLRGRASRGDAAFVAKQATALGYPGEFARAQTKQFAKDAGHSLETAARELRLAFFRECARRRRCPRLLLAHHADDQIETCLFNFLRGSGAAGLAGMRPDTTRKGLRILRPLLEIPRADMDGFVDTHRIPFREDHTNAESHHMRNRIRNLVIPAISQAFGESYRQAILRAAHIFRQEEEWMNSLTPEVSKSLSCASLREMSEALRHRTVLRWLRRNRVPEPGFAETRRVLSLLDTATGPAKVSLPGNRHARRRAGILFLDPK